MRSHLLASMTAVGLVVALGAPAWAQGTASATPVHPNLSGTWVLDPSLSDDPARATFEPPAAESRRMPGGRGSRFGFGPGGFRGTLGGGRGGERTAETLTADERTRLQGLTDQIRTGSGRLTIAHDDPSFAVTDALGRTAHFQTSGATDEHPAGASSLPTTSRWIGSRLVTEDALGGSHTLVFTYALLERTEQLVVRIRLVTGDDGRASGPEEKFAYSLAPSRPPGQIASSACARSAITSSGCSTPTDSRSIAGVMP